MILAVHQPTFFPYYPFFQKMIKSDIFVILNYVQFERRGYQNRFHIGNNWFTMSTNKGNQSDLIINKKYLSPWEDWSRLKRKLPQYKKLLDEFDYCICESLYITNINIINKITDMLNITTPMINDFPSQETATNKIIDLCRYTGANIYLSGISGKKYLKEDKLLDNGISLIYQSEEDMIKKPILEVLSGLN